MRMSTGKRPQQQQQEDDSSSSSSSSSVALANLHFKRKSHHGTHTFSSSTPPPVPGSPVQAGTTTNAAAPAGTLAITQDYEGRKDDYFQGLVETKTVELEVKDRGRRWEREKAMEQLRSGGPLPEGRKSGVVLFWSKEKKFGMIQVMLVRLAFWEMEGLTMGC